MLTAVRAHNAVYMLVFALPKQMQIEVTYSRAKPVGIRRLSPLLLRAAPAQLVLGGCLLHCAKGKQVCIRHTRHRAVRAIDHNLCFRGPGQQGPDKPMIALAMATENLEGVVMTPCEKAPDFRLNAAFSRTGIHFVFTDLRQPQLQEYFAPVAHNMRMYGDGNQINLS
jgi:hypothetical protein